MDRIQRKIEELCEENKTKSNVSHDSLIKQGLKGNSLYYRSVPLISVRLTQINNYKGTITSHNFNVATISLNEV